ncbi:hypothetical protein [Streptomyces anthocyanicus]|uniref:hypothetical protein n=1 Tax=Streptomyces anthocyanicus TaxID=68174 RepID=UPI0038267392
MTCVIRPEDFNPSTADPLRGRWSGAEVGTIVEALGGQPVAIEVRPTGFTLVGVTLVEVAHRGWSHGSPHVLIRGSGMEEAGVWYDLYQCGVILPLETGAPPKPGGDVKWRALEIFRQQRMAAIDAARAHERGQAAGRQYGTWKAVPMSGPGRYTVRYEPSQNPPANTPTGTRVSMDVRVRDGAATVWRVPYDQDRRAI